MRRFNGKRGIVNEKNHFQYDTSYNSNGELMGVCVYQARFNKTNDGIEIDPYPLVRNVTTGNFVKQIAMKYVKDALSTEYSGYARFYSPYADMDVLGPKNRNRDYFYFNSKYNFRDSRLIENDSFFIIAIEKIYTKYADRYSQPPAPTIAELYNKDDSGLKEHYLRQYVYRIMDNYKAPALGEKDHVQTLYDWDAGLEFNRSSVIDPNERFYHVELEETGEIVVMSEEERNAYLNSNHPGLKFKYQIEQEKRLYPTTGGGRPNILDIVTLEWIAVDSYKPFVVFADSKRVNLCNRVAESYKTNVDEVNRLFNAPFMQFQDKPLGWWNGKMKDYNHIYHYEDFMKFLNTFDGIGFPSDISHHPNLSDPINFNQELFEFYKDSRTATLDKFLHDIQNLDLSKKLLYGLHADKTINTLKLPKGLSQDFDKKYTEAYIDSFFNDTIKVKSQERSDRDEEKEIIF